MLKAEFDKPHEHIPIDSRQNPYRKSSNVNFKPAGSVAEIKDRGSFDDNVHNSLFIYHDPSETNIRLDQNLRLKSREFVENFKKVEIPKKVIETPE